jgi:hypothetical protein
MRPALVHCTSIHRHTSAYATYALTWDMNPALVHLHQHTSAYVTDIQHTSAYVSIRDVCAYVY